MEPPSEDSISASKGLESPKNSPESVTSINKYQFLRCVTITKKPNSNDKQSGKVVRDERDSPTPPRKPLDNVYIKKSSKIKLDDELESNLVSDSERTNDRTINTSKQKSPPVEKKEEEEPSGELSPVENEKGMFQRLNNSSITVTMKKVRKSSNSPPQKKRKPKQPIKKDEENIATATNISNPIPTSTKPQSGNPEPVKNPLSKPSQKYHHKVFQNLNRTGITITNVRGEKSTSQAQPQTQVQPSPPATVSLPPPTINSSDSQSSLLIKSIIKKNKKIEETAHEEEEEDEDLQIIGVHNGNSRNIALKQASVASLPTTSYASDSDKNDSEENLMDLNLSEAESHEKCSSDQSGDELDTLIKIKDPKHMREVIAREKIMRQIVRERMAPFLIGKFFQCNGCNFKSPRYMALHRHFTFDCPITMLMHDCPFCTYTSKYKRSLVEHVVIQHSQTILKNLHDTPHP